MAAYGTVSALLIGASSASGAIGDIDLRLQTGSSSWSAAVEPDPSMGDLAFALEANSEGQSDAGTIDGVVVDFPPPPTVGGDGGAGRGSASAAPAPLGSTLGLIGLAGVASLRRRR